jgi:hypothetical protein
VKVRVKRAGLQVRSRNGFFGTSDAESAPVLRTAREQLLHALAAPFNSGAIHLRLTTLFSNAAKAGSFVNAMLYIDANDLKLVNDLDGWRKSTFDVVAATFGDNGQPVDSSDRTFTFRCKDDGCEKVMKQGFIYRLHHPVKKPGAYQMRIALRDSNSQQVGSATQFIEVPDVDKGRLTLSSLVLSEDTSRTAAVNAEGEVHESNPLGSAAVRVFKPGTAMSYVYQVLNAHTDANKQPQLEAHTRLFRDGKLVYTGKPIPLQSDGQPDARHLLGAGSMKLGPNITLGDYVLQVVVTDKLAKEKNRVATQAMDFEIAR